MTKSTDLESIEADPGQADRLIATVDKILATQAGKAEAYLEKNKKMRPARLLRRLKKSLKRKEAWSGTAVGASAAVPGAGTAVAAALAAGQLTTHVSHAARYVMTVAALHGFDIRDVPRRRALFLTILLGSDAADVLAGGRTISSLGKAISALSATRATSLSLRLAKRMLTGTAKKTLTTQATRLAPFGIGALFGHLTGRSMATQIIRGTKRAFPEKL